jgi:hypothetical protein
MSRRTSTALSVAIVLTVTGGVVFAQAAKPESRSPFDESKVEDYIDQLASKNKEPPFVSFPGGYLPNFPANYDWDEEIRVRTVYDSLEDNMSEAVWRALAKHTGDKRFAFISRLDETKIGRTYDVGDLCYRLASHVLVHPGMRHVHVRNIKGQSLVDPKIRDLFKRSDPLYKLQIEVCERIIQDVKKLEDVADEKRTKFTTDLTEQIRVLTEKKTPLFSTSRTAFLGFPRGFDYRTELPKKSESD